MSGVNFKVLQWTLVWWVWSSRQYCGGKRVLNSAFSRMARVKLRPKLWRENSLKLSGQLCSACGAAAKTVAGKQPNWLWPENSFSWQLIIRQWAVVWHVWSFRQICGWKVVLNSWFCGRRCVPFQAPALLPRQNCRLLNGNLSIKLMFIVKLKINTIEITTNLNKGNFYLPVLPSRLWRVDNLFNAIKPQKWLLYLFKWKITLSAHQQWPFWNIVLVSI